MKYNCRGSLDHLLVQFDGVLGSARTWFHTSHFHPIMESRRTTWFDELLDRIIPRSLRRVERKCPFTCRHHQIFTPYQDTIWNRFSPNPSRPDYDFPIGLTRAPILHLWLSKLFEHNRIRDVIKHNWWSDLHYTL